MRTRVCTAGPLHSSGSACESMYQAIRAFDAQLRAGYAPFCPHLTHCIDPAGLAPREHWPAVELPWVQASHAVLRLSGASSDADLIVQFARENAIPIYYDLADLIEHLPAEATRSPSRNIRARPRDRWVSR